ncbi:MAG: DUF481 domain-containing protein [Kiritimatiellae bacterium]|nr:DUF481 domain-containing protein [Kiritimatiellia bacterium]MDW8457856.1 DUF481 domain-containing protein [Verrucomicrobiota bacterium]
MTGFRVLAAATLVWAAAEGADGKARPPKGRGGEGWKRQVQAGVNVTEGNRDSSLARAQFGGRGRGEGWDTELNLKAEIGRADGVQNRERVAAEAAHRRGLTDRAYMAYRLDATYDAIAELDYRIIGSLSLGWYAIRDDQQEFRLEVGPAGVVERKEGVESSRPAIRIAEAYEARITKVSRMVQGVEYVPELDADPNDYLLRAHVELRSDLDVQLSLHVRLEADYDNNPAEGKDKQDTVFSVSFGYSF